MTLAQYVNNWVSDYQKLLTDLDLFKPGFAKNWNLIRKQKFVKLLFHYRGRFNEFLWYLGGLAPAKKYKDVVLYNIEQEFNNATLSHDQMFFNFAKQFNVDLNEEIMFSANYLDFLKKFNNNHLERVLTRSWDTVYP